VLGELPQGRRRPVVAHLLGHAYLSRVFFGRCIVGANLSHSMAVRASPAKGKDPRQSLCHQNRVTLVTSRTNALPHVRQSLCHRIPSPATRIELFHHFLHVVSNIDRPDGTHLPQQNEGTVHKTSSFGLEIRNPMSQILVSMSL
jgi:hypothetical protein